MKCYNSKSKGSQGSARCHKKHGKARKNTKKCTDAEVSVIHKAKNNEQTQLPHTQIIALIKTYINPNPNKD